MHESVVYHRRVGCNVCVKNYRARVPFWKNMKGIGHSCAVDTSTPVTILVPEYLEAEQDMRKKRFVETFLLLNNKASARQITELNLISYFTSNRLCFTEDINNRLLSHCTYEYDPFGRRVEGTIMF